MNKKGTELLSALEHALVSNSARIVLTTGEVWVREQEPAKKWNVDYSEPTQAEIDAANASCAKLLESGNWVPVNRKHPMTRKDILELSTKLQRAEDFLDGLMNQNSVLDPEHKLSRYAQRKLAASWVDKARKDYNDAIGSLSADQLERLAKGEEI